MQKTGWTNYPSFLAWWSGLVWKRVSFWLGSLEASQQPFSCVLGHFLHGDEHPTGSGWFWSKSALDKWQVRRQYFAIIKYHFHRHHLYNPHLTSAPSKQHPPPPTASGLATRKGGTWRLLCNNIIIILTIITTTMIIKNIAIWKRRTRLRICKCYTMIQKQPDFWFV